MPFWKVRGVTSAGRERRRERMDLGSQGRWGRGREVCTWREGDPVRRAPALVRSLTPGRVWRGAGLGCSPLGIVGGPGGPDKGWVWLRGGQGRGVLNPGAARGGASSRGRGLVPGRGPLSRGRSLIQGAWPSPGGAGRPQGRGCRGRGSGGWSGPRRPEVSAGWLAGGCGRTPSELLSERSGPGHGAAGGGRAAADAAAAAARTAARGECAGRRGGRRPGPGSPRPPTWRGRRGCTAGDSGPGRRRPPGTPDWHRPPPPSSVALSRRATQGTPRGSGGWPGPRGSPVGRPATLPSLGVAVGMARPCHSLRGRWAG